MSYNVEDRIEPVYQLRSNFEVLPDKNQARERILEKIEFHHTPKHGSWLNAAEIEIRILEQQCLNRRIPNEKLLKREADAWVTNLNLQQKGIECKFDWEGSQKNLNVITIYKN
jgi:hypothetical protein